MKTMKNTIHIVLMLACCLFGQNLMAQSATLNIEGIKYAIDYTMSAEYVENYGAKMQIDISKPLDGNNHTFIDAILKGAAIDRMVITQSENNGTLKIVLRGVSVVDFKTEQSSSGKNESFVVVCHTIRYEFTSNQVTNVFSHTF
jgi:hypothetical protein